MNPPTSDRLQISLRDWFAGMALQGMLSNGGEYNSRRQGAAVAYAYADAMLAEKFEPSSEITFTPQRIPK